VISARAVDARGQVGAAPIVSYGPQSADAAVQRPLERDARWSILLLCISVYVLSAVARIHQLVPAIGALRPALLSAAATLLLIAIDPGAIGRLRAAWAIPGIRWLIALLVWAVLSVPLALYPGGAFDLVVNNLMKAVAMVVAVVVAVRGVQDVRRLAVVFFAGVVIFALFAMSSFPVDPLTGRLNNLVFYDANEFSLLGACSLPYGAFFVWRVKGVMAKGAILAAMGVVFAVFVSCGSRGAFLALLAGLLVTVTSLGAIKLRWRVTAIAVVATAFIGGTSEQFWKRMDMAVDTGTDYNLTSPTGRVQVWKRGIGYMMDRPILGVGAGNFATAEGRLSEYAAGLRSRSGSIKWSAAHNSFVQVGAELGVPGLVFFSAALFGTMFALRRVSRPRKGVAVDLELVGLASASIVALVIFTVGAAFLSLAYSDILFTLLAIAMGVQVEARRRAKRAGLVAA
jgi:O-antigen ligase